MTQRVQATEAAKEIIDQLREQHGELMFHQSGGCCDGSSPMCFPKGDLMINETDVYLGTIHGCEFFMSKDQFEYWKHTQLTVDITPGRGSSFSLEIPLGIRFVIKSRMYTEDEAKDLSPTRSGEE
ncbi:MAG: UDP-glucose 4-epimerase [Leeuwenhoekiella sp.]|nr:MAG: UDP-glucose 4-epimerase [Leeuwenhoekiella sp.]